MNTITVCPLLYGFASTKGKPLPVSSFNAVFGREGVAGPVLAWPGALGVPVRFRLKDGEQLCLQIDVPAAAEKPDEFDFTITNAALDGTPAPHIHARLDGSDKSSTSFNVPPGAVCAVFRTPGGIKRNAPMIEHGSHGFLTIETADGKAGDVWLVAQHAKR